MEDDTVAKSGLNQDCGACEHSALRLESLLEYTNRIKVFLGLVETEEINNLSTNEDSPSDPHSIDTETQVNAVANNVQSLSGLNSGDAESDVDQSMAENSSKPLPDVIEIQSDSSKYVEHELFPDILERSEHSKIVKPETVFESSTVDETSDNLIESGDINDLDNFSLVTVEASNETDVMECIVIADDINNASNLGLERGLTRKDDDTCFSEKDLKQTTNQDGENNILKETGNEKYLEAENSYQITHIEESLRQAEKSLKSKLFQDNEHKIIFKITPNEPDEPQTEFKDLFQVLGSLQTIGKDISQKPNEKKTIFKEVFQDSNGKQTTINDISENSDQQQTIFKDVSQSSVEQQANAMSQEPGEQTIFKDVSQTSVEQQAIAKDVSQVPGEQQTIFKDVSDKHPNDGKLVDPFLPLKSRSKVSMEDIRRLSTEVVNSVLLTAEDEVNVILQNRDYVNEENVPDIVQVDTKIPLQDTVSDDASIECGLPDIAEEGISSVTTDASFENLTSSIAMKSMPVGSKHSIDRIEVTDEIDIDVQCGFGPFKPECIQPYATANVYVILYSIIGILHGSYYTYLVGVLTTLEKRFEFKSKTSGFIMILDELTPLFLGVLVGHFGGRAHRPRLLSFGMFLSAFSCFASALPYFLYGTSTHLSFVGSLHNKTSAEMCIDDIRIEHCETNDRPPTVTAILLLMLGSFLKGFGNLAYYAIGLAYLDDNAKKRNTPLYFAVAFALRLLGPMVGFLMSSAFLKYYENPFEIPDFGPEDPRWIGGWWMGFVLQGFLLLLFAGPLALFPRRLSDHAPLIHEHNSKSMFDGLGDSLKRLVRNPLYMLIGLNTIFYVYGNFGYYIMLPKYMENQFRLSASSASLYAGPPGIAALMVSCIIGGYLIWKFKPTARFLAGGLVTLEFISTLGYLILMIPQCDNIRMTHFGMGEESLILESECNMNCSCSTTSYFPVCATHASYFSPCYAGCTTQNDQSFYNCSCVESVRKGVCSSDNCWSQALAYIVTLPALQFIVNILRVAYTMIMLRSIKAEDKNMALGVLETVLSTIAFIPFPVLYGALVDSACLVWERSCGESGNCWFYDIRKFNHLMHGGSAFFCGLSTLNLIAIFCLVHRIKDLYSDDE